MIWFICCIYTMLGLAWFVKVMFGLADTSYCVVMTEWRWYDKRPSDKSLFFSYLWCIKMFACSFDAGMQMCIKRNARLLCLSWGFTAQLAPLSTCMWPAGPSLRTAMRSALHHTTGHTLSSLITSLWVYGPVHSHKKKARERVLWIMSCMVIMKVFPSEHWQTYKF